MPQEGDKRRDKNKLFRVLVIVLMLVVILLLLLQRCARGADDSGLEQSVKAKLGQLEGKTEEQIQAELDRVIEEGMFHVSINTDPMFQDGEAEGNLEIENVPRNLYSMRVVITLDEDGRTVYDSGLINPNYHVQRDNLSEDLPAGDYPANVTFFAYDLDTQEEIGTVACVITIHVLN